MNCISVKEPLPISVYSGTLIIAACCNDGLVLAGDKGAQMMIGQGPPKFITDQEKIAGINDRIIMATSGTAKITTPDESRTDLVNGISISKEYCKKYPLRDTTKFWRGLSEEIAMGFDRWLNLGGIQYQLTGDFIYFYRSDSGSIELFMLRMQFDPIMGVEMSGGRPKMRHLMTWGYANVLTDLDENKPSVADFRKTHPVVDLFIQTDFNHPERTVTRGTEFVDLIMEQTSKVPPSKGHVSREFDCCSLEGKIPAESVE